MNFDTVLLGQRVAPLELIGAATGIAGVWLTARQSILCFPIGIVNVLVYLYIFMQPDIRLYADALLQIAFCSLLVYGWINWKNVRMRADVRKKPMTSTDWTRFVGWTFCGAAVLGSCLDRWTDASLPWLDATLTAFSLGAQWMVARMKRENWWIWIVVNAVYIPLYLYKGLPVTALLYAVYLLLAVKGLRQWKRLSNQTTD